jgi:hypothetical protein
MGDHFRLLGRRRSCAGSRRWALIVAAARVEERAEELAQDRLAVLKREHGYPRVGWRPRDEAIPYDGHDCRP